MRALSRVILLQGSATPLLDGAVAVRSFSLDIFAISLAGTHVNLYLPFFPSLNYRCRLSYMIMSQSSLVVIVVTLSPIRALSVRKSNQETSTHRLCRASRSSRSSTRMSVRQLEVLITTHCEFLHCCILILSLCLTMTYHAFDSNLGSASYFCLRHSTGRGGAGNLTSAEDADAHPTAEVPTEEGIHSHGKGGYGNIIDTTEHKKHTGLGEIWDKVTHPSGHKK